MLTGKNLVDELRKLADKAEKSLWVVSPFIGSWASVERILGNKWLEKKNFEVKLLTDIANKGSICKETVEKFSSRGEVKTLRGLHAKLYIIDDKVLVTSANLTRSAFRDRYEIGILLEDNSEVLKIFNDWWNNKDTKFVDLNDIEKIKPGDFNETNNLQGLKPLWDLPPKPSYPRIKPDKPFDDYDSFLKFYEDFARIYYAKQKLWKTAYRNGYIYCETDSFLSYLYHYEQKPSKGWELRKIDNLSSKEREEQIKLYANLYKKWLSNTDKDSERSRIKTYQKIEKILRSDNIMNANREDIVNVVKTLDCLTTSIEGGSHLIQFLEKNGDNKKILEAWNYLLHNNQKHYETRMLDCFDSKSEYKLNHFGKSAIQELFGYFYYQEFPKRNIPVNAGLRFFGYDVMHY
jgi:hypothetical protein